MKVSSSSLDLGLNVEGLNMAAGAEVVGNWIDNVEWVRNLLIMAQSDQQFDIRVYRRDKALIADWGTALLTNQSAAGTSWKPVSFIPQNGSGVSSILGYSAKFGLKNSAAVVNTFGRMRVQLLGL